MKKKILIPTDFSKNAWNALTYAVQLHEKKDCEFLILNSYELSNYNRTQLVNSGADAHSFESEKDESLQKLKKLKLEITKSHAPGNHTFETVSILDEPLEAMKTVIANRDIDLVVMGTKGSSNYKNKAFGSNTINAMENLRSCPILGIPMDAKLTGLSTIVFPSNFKVNFKHGELSHLLKIANQYSSTIDVVHVTKGNDLTEDQKNKKKLLFEILGDVESEYHEIDKQDVAEGVSEYLNTNEPHMIALIDRKHNFFSKFFSTDILSKLGMFSTIPLLILHDSGN